MTHIEKSIQINCAAEQAFALGTDASKAAAWMENLPSRVISRLTIAIGIVAVIGLVAIILFFTIGGFWGPLNDLSIAIEAILCAVLAWMLHPIFRIWSPRSSQLTLIAALAAGVKLPCSTPWHLAAWINSFGTSCWCDHGAWLVEHPWNS